MYEIQYSFIFDSLNYFASNNKCCYSISDFCNPLNVNLSHLGFRREGVSEQVDPFAQSSLKQ